MNDMTTTPAREAILTCLACGAKNPRALPYDMVAPDSCGECGVSLRSGDLGAIRDEALEEAARVADDLAEIARKGAILGQCDPLEAGLLDAGLSGCAAAIRALKSQSPTKDAPDMVLVPREPTRTWASILANVRQGKSSTPRCEPPGEYEIQWAHDRIAEVLEAAMLMRDYPKAAAAPVADGGEG